MYHLQPIQMTFILSHLFKDAALSILLALIALESEVPILHAPYNNTRSIIVACVPYSYAYIDTRATSDRRPQDHS